MEQHATLQYSQNGRMLLDEVIYLASLASDRHMIDPILNAVRAVTANLQAGHALSEQERASLVQVRAQLTNHLVHNDKLRSFTENELDRQVAEALGTARVQHESLHTVIKIILIAVAAYPVGVLLMVIAHLPNPLLLAATFMTTALYIGLIWLYWSSLGTFTPQLRIAYRWICINMVGLCVTAASATIFSSFPALGNIPLLSYGGFVTYVGLTGFVIGYEGLRRFASAINVKTRLTSWRFALFASLSTCVLVNLLPHTPVPDNLVFHIGITPWILVSFYSLMVFILGRKIARQVTKRYARAISWFAAAYAQAMLLAAGTIVMILLTGPVYNGAKMTIIYFVFGTCGISLVMSGYMFSRSVGKS